MSNAPIEFLSWDEIPTARKRVIVVNTADTHLNRHEVLGTNIFTGNLVWLPWMHRDNPDDDRAWQNPSAPW